MRRNRSTKVMAATLAAVLLFQAAPTNAIAAYAAELNAQANELRDELAAKAGDYPAGAFAFYEAESALKEGDADYGIQIVRWGDTSAEATVDVKVLELTATYGEDFEVYAVNGLMRDTLEEKDVEPSDEAEPSSEATEAAAETGQDAAAETEVEQDAEASAEQEPVEERVPFTPVESGEAVEEQSAESASDQDAESSDSSEEDGISSMRDSYAIQTGNDTKRTNWRGEYEESLAPVAVAETANNIVNAIPGATGTLTFAPGEYAKTIYVSVKDDDLAESKEAFRLMLGNASAGVLGEQMQHTVSIEDNEEGEKIAFAMKDAEVTVEPDAEYAEVTVTRTSGTNYYAGAVLGTAAGTADPESSYEAIDGATVPFAAGTTEQTIQVKLKENAQPGTQFSVQLDPASINVDGIAETVVKIAGDGAATGAEDEATSAAAETMTPAAEPVSAASADARTTAAPRYVHDGITYDGTEVSPWKTVYADGADASASFTYTNASLSKEATRIVARINVWGSTDHWIFGDPAYKNWSMSFGGRSLINGRSCNGRDVWYTEQFNISYNEGKSGGLWLKVNTDKTNYNGRIRLETITYYYPRFTVSMNAADYNKTLKGKNYTSTSDYTEFNVSALAKQHSNKTITIAHGGSNNVAPASVADGVYVQKYEIYSGSTKVGESADAKLTYSELSELRKNHDDTLRNNKYKLTVRPVYKTYASTVTFESQDASAIGFSGDKAGGSGFKTGDTLKATQIDTVTLTAECPTDQKVKPLAVAQYHGSSQNGAATSLDKNYPGTDALTLKVSKIDLTHPKHTFRALYQDVSLTYEYTPSEADAVNAGVGAISVYDAENLEEPLGVSNYLEPLTLKDDLEMIAGNKYVARVIKGELPEGVSDADKIKYFLESELIGGVPFSTRTIWTYTNPKTGQKESVKGLSLLFDPYYADEVVNYHFKNEQDDRAKVGVSGTVYVKEKPLFSANAQQTEKAAVGVQINVGGENTTSDKDGSYTIPAKFNKSDYVSAFLTYDSLTMMSNVALSEDTTKDFYIDVSESDPVKITESSIQKRTATGTKDMNNEDVYKSVATSSVLLEDTDYTFTLGAQGSAGVLPAKAEFRFYDKKGNLKADKTQTAMFDGAAATLTLNPKSAGLEVGDSMTVKVYDANGNGYFEHQTSVTLGKKTTGMYMFNYEGTKSEDDNLFLKALGNISVGYDFALDTLAANAGTYEDEDGVQHQLMFIGFGDGFSNTGENPGEEVYNTLQQTIADIDDASMGDRKFGAYDSLAFFGNGNWSFNISVGMIYDMVMEPSGDRAGEYKFSDFVMLAEAAASYSKEWKVPAGPANLTFSLEFGFDNPGGDTEGVAVKWYFYDPDQGYFVEDNSTIDLMADENVENKGFFEFTAYVTGALRAEFLGDLIGGEGGLTVTVGNTLSYDSTAGMRDYGKVILTPKVKLVVLGIGIPVWSQSWEQPWDTGTKQTRSEASAQMMRAIDEGLSPEQVLFTSTSEGEMQDYSYTENRSGWNGGDDTGFDLFGLFSAPAEETEDDETVLQDGFLTDSDISLYDLGGGDYLVAFLDAVEGRDDANKMGAYWATYVDGAWSEPQLLSDDGTEDQVPVISDAGDAGVLIAWSSASEKLNEGDDLSEQLNTFDIEGAFYKDGTLGNVMQITETTSEDRFADTNPQAVSYTNGDGEQRVKVYYTKSEFSVSNPSEGEVTGDILNPDQLNLVREYDVASKRWIDTYDSETEQGIRDMLRGELGEGATEEQVNAAYEEYLENWYGQVFLELAPAVDITEELGEDGRWAEGTQPSITKLDEGTASQRIVKDSAAVAYNGLGLLAYSLDKGGMAQATEDQNLYLQIFNGETGEYHHPVMISGTDAEISDIQFIRSTYKATDGSEPEITWLYWKEQTPTTITGADGEEVESSVTTIKRIDVSTLVSDPDNLILNEEDADHPYYYINKAADNDAYAPEQAVVSSTSEASEGEKYLSIGNFQVKASADGRYNFVAWTQPVAVGEGEDARQEFQLFALREDLHTGDVSSPVQLTDAADQYLGEFDFAVTDEGDIDVLAGRQTLAKTTDEETGASIYEPNPQTSELIFMQIVPSDEVSVDDAAEGGLTKGHDGVEVALSTTVRNGSFDAIDSVNVEVVDNQSGKTVYSSKDVELSTTSDPVIEETGDGGVTFEGGTETTAQRGLITLEGGDAYELPFSVPVDDAGAYDVTFRVTADGTEIATKQIKGQVPVKLGASGLAANVLDRDQIGLSATITNNSVLASSERAVSYGYLDADGNEVELGTAKVESLEPGATTTFAVELDQDFSTFDSQTLEDGSLRDSRRYYLDLEPASKATRAETADEGVVEQGDDTATKVYGEVELLGTSGQVALMKKANDLGAVLAEDDGEGGIQKKGSIKAGEYAELAFTVNGGLAQDSEEYINGFKVVWDAVDTDVATVDEDGTFHAKKAGTVKLTGKVMPANTSVVVGEQAASEEVDNYPTLPESLIKAVSATVSVAADGGSGGGNDGNNGNGGNNGNNDNNGGGGNNNGGSGAGANDGLAETGDSTNPTYVIMFVTAGAALVVASVCLRRRHNEKKGC